MLRLALPAARHRIAALLAIVCATLVGAALITCIGVIAESGLRSHTPAERLVGADIVVSAGQSYTPAGDLPIVLPERAGVPSDLTARLARLPGVTTAIGDVSFPAAVIDAEGVVVPAEDPRTAGHGWSSTFLLDAPHVSGAAPAGPGEVALDDDLATAAGVLPGDRVVISAAGQQGDYRVSAVITTPQQGGVFFADPTAAELAGGSGTVDLVALRTAPGATESVVDEVQDSLDASGLLVSTGSAIGDVEDLAATTAQSLLPLLAFSMAGTVLLIIGFIVGGASAVSVGAQRQDLALLRAIGALPRQIRRFAAAQATIVALPSTAVGLAAGYLLAEQFRRLLTSIGLIPSTLSLSISPLPAIGAGLLMVAVVQAAARCAAWRTSRLPATEAVTVSRSEPRTPSKFRTWAGILLIVGATAFSVTPLLIRSQLAAATTATAGIVAVVGLALVGPALVGWFSRALARKLPAGVSAPSWLAVANGRDYALRMAAASTTLAMAVVFTITYTFTQTTLMAATVGDVTESNRAQISISAPELGGVPDDLAAAVAAEPGVQAAVPVSSTTVLWPYQFAGETEVESTSAFVLTDAAPAVLDLDLRAGDLAELTGDTVAVDAGVAGSRDVSVGSEISLILGDGSEVNARVVATYARGLGFGPVVLSRDLVAGHASTGLDDSILIRTDGTDLTRQNLAAVTESRPGLVLNDSVAALGGTVGVSPELWMNIAVLAVLLGYLLLGITNKMVAATAQRRNELATLRLIGATARQILAMMRREAALICAVSVAAGLLLSIVPIVLLSIGFLDRPWPAGPAWLLPLIAVVVVVITFLAIELPTRRLLCTPPVEARTHPS
ncbi:putative ABC transport system permease protein [Saccharopolyspora antimicrobica]|uniref:ABC transport system permease protein n=1 Tax=Saccharopolyspora antimicrobica TaxID=455193 RepID=A0A1I5B852_9PSEU|nr:ABC transporter permease [Saccharopolyspora antimicrobica]RKT86500.1 putative ABC transport system permease protein [Saccharopolyspora antimicrobica]SFN70885.1 putative ABC transport system permease protein [Saccharopolyspora antimicrobica]